MQRAEKTDDTSVAISTWLCERVASYTNKQPEEIDSEKHLSNYGVDSMVAISLTGDIEKRFGVPLEDTAVWDHPSIVKMTSYVMSELARLTM